MTRYLTGVLASALLLGCNPDADRASGPANKGMLAQAVPAASMPLSYDLQPDIQHDVIARHAGASDFQPSMDYMSWTTFIALNWPGSSVQRGEPDRDNIIGGQPGNFGESQAMPVGPVVWEGFRAPGQIFLNPPIKPAPFDSQPSVPPVCQGVTEADARVLTTTAKLDDFANETLQAGSDKPLYDQNGNVVWYEVMLNRSIFDFIVDNGYYNRDNQPPSIIEPYGSNQTAAVGGIRIKAAWKVIGANDDPKRFYTTEVYTYDGKSCQKQRVGLVGLHVVHKTATRGNWVWSTFEHVDNAPTQGAIDTSKHYNFYNPACSDCPINTPNAEGVTTPTQVVRITPIPEATQELNKQFQRALIQARADNVWQYYMLVDTQWPGMAGTAGAHTDINHSQPLYLANTTMETYLQGPTQPNGTPRSCIGCHAFANPKGDFGFQLGKACPSSGCVITPAK